MARYACQVHEEEKDHEGRALVVPEAVCDEGQTDCLDHDVHMVQAVLRAPEGCWNRRGWADHAALSRWVRGAPGDAC